MKRTPMPPRKKPMRKRTSRPNAKTKSYDASRGGVDIDRVHSSPIVGRGTGQQAVRAIMAWALDSQPVTIPKSLEFRSEPYRRLVATLPCFFCGAVGRSQACHMNGGGMGTKHDDRLIFPGCADEPGRRGCHMTLDQGGVFTKHAKRRIEAAAVLWTIEKLQREGRWPGLPLPDVEMLERMAE